MWRWSSGFPTSIAQNGVWPTNWNNNNFALSNGTPVSTQHGTNIFPDPKAAIQAFGYELPGGIGTRNPIRGDGLINVDTSLSKRFVLPWKDGGHSLQVRWETFNLTNTTRFDVGFLSQDISNGGTFGRYSSQLTTPRVMQFGLRYEF